MPVHAHPRGGWGVHGAARPLGIQRFKPPDGSGHMHVWHLLGPALQLFDACQGLGLGTFAVYAPPIQTLNPKPY